MPLACARGFRSGLFFDGCLCGLFVCLLAWLLAASWLGIRLDNVCDCRCHDYLLSMNYKYSQLCGSHCSNIVFFLGY